MKAHLFVISIAAILCVPAYASAQDTAPATNVKYEKAGNFAYATAAYTLDRCRVCDKPLFTVIVRCPAGYVALGRGYYNRALDAHGVQRASLYNLWADEPTKDRNGWLIGAQRYPAAADEIQIVVTCGLASQ